MDSVSVLIGSPVCQDSVILKEYLLSLMNLDITGLSVDFLFIDDNTEEKSKIMLNNFKVPGCRVDIIDMKNQDEYVHTEVTHTWKSSQIWKVAGYRNEILNKAKHGKYDYCFMVDSDLLLNPKTLRHLIEQNKDIISEIFWTRWVPGAKEFPQVWLYDNYTLYEIDRMRNLSESEKSLRTQDFINKLKVPGVYKVGGLGACTLISRRAMESGICYDPIPNLSFSGEDRHFCIRAAVLGFDMYVDTNYAAFHIYRKKDLKEAEEFKQKCNYRLYSQ